MWESLEGIDLTTKEKEIFEQLLNQRHVNHRNREDKLIWGASKDGLYSVKNECDLIINSQNGKRLICLSSCVGIQLAS